MAKKNETGAPRSSIDRIGIVIGAVILVAVMLFVSGFFSASRETTWHDFENRIMPKNAVEKIIVVNKETAEVFLKPEFLNDTAFQEATKTLWGVKAGPHYTFTIGSVETLERKLEETQVNVPATKRIPVEYQNRGGWTSLLVWLIPVGLTFLMIRFLSGAGGPAGGSSPFNFGRSTAKLFENDKKSSVTFDQVAGLEEAKQEVKEIVDFLKDPQRYTRLGAKIPKGVIIVGPPGTGKTLLARAVAGEARVPFFSLSGSEFVEMFVGVGASRVRDLFRRAKEKAPCIIFIDEIDAVGRSRGKNTFNSGVNDERESTLNQLLTELDGFGTNSGVIVLAATNRADVLDTALLRPGRFDRHIYLELPNQSERKAIFSVHLKPLTLSENVDPDFLASQTPGFSGADIANICNEAALIAARRRKNKVEQQDFSDAIDRIVAGLEKKSKIISPAEKKIIAYHEAGHAVISWMLPTTDPLVKVSIIPRGKSLGAAWYLPEERQIQTYTQFRERIIATLGGRAAEETIFGEVSSGAVDDLEKVTREAYTMTAYFGFNKKLGNVSFYDSTGRSEMALQKPYSEDTAKLIDEEVRNLIDDCYQEAKTILSEHRQALEQIAKLLLHKEVIRKDEIEAALGKRNKMKAMLQPAVT